jgi:hypothetical protein
MSSLLNRGGTFVTIIAPVFRNVDKYGLVSGLSRTAYKAVRQTLYVRKTGGGGVRIFTILNRDGQMV